MNDQVRMKVLEKWNAQLRRVCAGRRKRKQSDGDTTTRDNLQREFVRPRQSEISLFYHLAVVIEETDDPKHEHSEDSKPHVAVLEVAPKQRGNNCRAHDQHASHGRRSGLG